MANYTLHFFLSSLAFLAFLAEASTEDDEQCLKAVKYITSSSGLRAKISPNIIGNWTSSRCEVRHGAKFLTRSFSFLPNKKWSGLFHHYSDWQCSKPTFTLSVSGNYQIYKESKGVKGGTGAYFNFTSIRLHAHTQQIAARILSIASKSCPNTLRRLSNTLKDAFSVSNRAFSKRSCRNAFGISEYELRLLRLESYSVLGKKFDRLFFAEIPTTEKTKRKYKPEGYQMPLLRSNAVNCSICTLINGASADQPPKLSRSPRPTPRQLTGEWGSSTCEARPNGKFITRYLITNTKKGIWEGHFFYFFDSDCTDLNFILYGKGAFSGGEHLSTIPGGMKYTFMVTEARLTIFDIGTVGILNTARDKTCGVPGEWKRGVEHDITQTQGCTFFGIRLPHTEYDLLTMRVNHLGIPELYIGQRPSDGGSPDTPEKVPTSFQIPLLKCSSFPFRYVQATSLPTSPTTHYKYPDVFTISTGYSREKDDKFNQNGQTNKKVDIMAFENSAFCLKTHGEMLIILISATVFTCLL